MNVTATYVPATTQTDIVLIVGQVLAFVLFIASELIGISSCKATGVGEYIIYGCFGYDITLKPHPPTPPLVVKVENVSE